MVSRKKRQTEKRQTEKRQKRKDKALLDLLYTIFLV